MDNTIQLYVDKKKEIKGYPITSPDRVIDENGVNIKEEIEEINSSLENIENHTKGKVNIYDFCHLVVEGDWKNAIEQAINGTNGICEIFFPNGEYGVSSAINIIGGDHYTRGGIKLTGENKANTIIRLINNDNSLINIPNQAYNIDFANITFDGNGKCETTIKVDGSLIKSSWTNLIINGGNNGVIFSNDIWQNNFDNIMIYGTNKGFIMQKHGTSNVINNSFVYGTKEIGWGLRGMYSTANGIACDNFTGIGYDFYYASWDITSLGAESNIFTNVISTSHSNINIGILNIFTSNNSNDFACVWVGNDSNIVINQYNLTTGSTTNIECEGKIFNFGSINCYLEINKLNVSNYLKYSGKLSTYSDTARTYLKLEGVLYELMLSTSGVRQREIIGNYKDKTYKANNDYNRRCITWCSNHPYNNSHGNYEWNGAFPKGTLFLSENANASNVAGFIRSDEKDINIMRDANYKAIPIILSGATSSRPTENLIVGMQFFDTSMVKPIWWTGSRWVDSTGTTV